MSKYVLYRLKIRSLNTSFVDKQIIKWYKYSLEPLGPVYGVYVRSEIKKVLDYYFNENEIALHAFAYRKL